MPVSRGSARMAGADPRPQLDPRAALTALGETVYDWDIVSDTITWGDNAREVFGLPEIARLGTGRALALAVEPESGVTRHAAIFGSEAREGEGIPYRAQYTLRLDKTRLLRVEDTGRWYPDAEGAPAFAHGIVRVGEAEPEARPAGGGWRDRALFLDQINGAVAESGRARRALTLFVIAIDDLARHNEDLGHEGADELVAEVVRRLRRVMRGRDRFTRYAGNRFAVALLSCPAEQAPLAATRLASAVETHPIVTPRGKRLARLVIGAASAPDHATEAAALLQRAEGALTSARQAGCPYLLYDPALVREAAKRARGTPPMDIVEALNDRRLILACQPVVDSSTRAEAFCEALARLRAPDGRIVAAGDILPAVERAGLVPLVDTRMLELVADELAAHPEQRLSINVSPQTLESATWLGTLAAHLGARPGIASRLIVEVTETVAVREPAATRSRLEAMKALGVAIAIDDFGAGHTSFKHLRNFPVDILKIDGAFVQNLARSPDDRFFVRTLIDLAHHLNIATVAEWVEDESVARQLADWGVDYLQGNLCGAPRMPVRPSREERAA